MYIAMPRNLDIWLLYHILLKPNHRIMYSTQLMYEFVGISLLWFQCVRRQIERTHIHTHKPTTVTHAAHARRGLIMIRKRTRRRNKIKECNDYNSVTITRIHPNTGAIFNFNDFAIKKWFVQKLWRNNYANFEQLQRPSAVFSPTK